MNDAQKNPLAAPNPARRGSWTARIILSTLACGIGLWLGMGTRNVSAGGETAKRPVAPQTAIADLFRFNILLAGKDSAAKPVRPKPASEIQHKLPAQVLLAMAQRPEPIPAAMTKSLSCAFPRFKISAHVRPDAPWRIKLEANMAHLEHTQAGLKAFLATLPENVDAGRKSSRVEVDKTCEQIGSLRMEREMAVPQPPEPAEGFPEARLDPQAQFIP